MNWVQFYDLILRFGGWLVQPSQTVLSVPQHAAWGEPNAQEEKWADDWLQQFFQNPDFSKVLTPRQRYVLVPRFRYAAIEASIYAKMIPTEQVPDVRSKLVELLIQRWPEWRTSWLIAPHQPEDDEDSLAG